jgi:hypothetical protein
MDGTLPRTRERSARLRLLETPHYHGLFGARLEGIVERPHRGGTEIALDVIEQRPLAEPEPCLVDGLPAERVWARELPRRVSFPRAAWWRRSGPFAQLAELPLNDLRRILYGLRRVRIPSAGELFFFGVEEGELVVRARRCTLEDRPGEVSEVEVIRRWTPAPTQPARLVPTPRRLHTTYAGDPIAIHLGRRRFWHRLFIGGLRHQSSVGMRPAVDAVLNLCDVPNAWLCGGEWYAGDRWEEKGEGRRGMTAEDLKAEAVWVAERLRAGQRVLVHCYAGINRSATVCCAALILLEGLSAEAALARVRERHPEAWPDPYHWLLLRWLAADQAPIFT